MNVFLDVVAEEIRSRNASFIPGPDKMVLKLGTSVHHLTKVNEVKTHDIPITINQDEHEWVTLLMHISTCSGYGREIARSRRTHPT